MKFQFNIFLAALGLAFVLEGLPYFLSPNTVKRMLVRMLEVKPFSQAVGPRQYCLGACPCGTGQVHRLEKSVQCPKSRVQSPEVKTAQSPRPKAQRVRFQRRTSNVEHRTSNFKPQASNSPSTIFHVPFSIFSVLCLPFLCCYSQFSFSLTVPHRRLSRISACSSRKTYHGLQ